MSSVTFAEAYFIDRLFKKGHPSTYTMSKAFAEELIYKYGLKLPVAVVRPSIIVGAFQDPQPGYVQGYQVNKKNVFHLHVDSKVKILFRVRQAFWLDFCQEFSELPFLILM
jgi:nucleoside-diphosphate-sugar epimerase